MSKETCPHCGKEYKRLSVHLLYCKEKPEEDTVDLEGALSQTFTVNLDPIIGADYTASDDIPVELEEEPLVEAQTIPCTYLVVIAGSGCSTCKGTTCMASKDKKISNEDFCKYEWQDCILYEESTEAGVRASCPYISLTVPEGRYSCTGMWCHARDKAVKVDKLCRSWEVCGSFLQAKSDGKPVYRKAIT